MRGAGFAVFFFISLRFFLALEVVLLKLIRKSPEALPEALVEECSFGENNFYSKHDTKF